MLIKSLRMENFRQFKGKTEMDFSCDPERNVTIILGDNSFGKTTLLQAFNWCFYGKIMFDQNPDFLLNLEVAGDMNRGESKNVEVEVTLTHDDVEYIISRVQCYTFYGSVIKGEAIPQAKVSYKGQDGQTESVKAVQVKNVINNIFPEDLSTYFFFDTERVNNISTRKDVAEAVKGLLGLSIMDSAIKHLGTRGAKTTVIGKLYSSMDMEGDSKAQEALKRMQTAEEKRNLIAVKLEECASQIKHYERRKEQLEDILRDNQTTTKLQKNKEDLEKRIKEEKQAFENAINAYFKEFSQGSLPFFSQPLIKATNAFLKEVKVDDKGIQDLTKPTIIELIKRGKCICGADICKGNDAYKKLMEELAYVPPESIGNTVRHFKEKLTSYPRSAAHTYESLMERYELIYRSKNRIQEWNDELIEISGQIKGKENMRQYEDELVDLKIRLKELNSKKESLIREDEAQISDKDRYKKVYDSLVVVSEKNKSTIQLIDYAVQIRDWLTETYKDKEGVIKDALETKVNDIFKRMYHGHRRVVINQKYEVSLLTTVSDKEILTGESEGMNRVKNFAFIAGLVSLAKEKIITDSTDKGFDLYSEPYPLVMDAPFSNADATHITNISKVLPEIAEQVIMFVMEKDWYYSKPVMSSKVGKQYYLQKNSETYTQIQ